MKRHSSSGSPSAKIGVVELLANTYEIGKIEELPSENIASVMIQFTPYLPLQCIRRLGRHSTVNDLFHFSFALKVE